MSEAKMRVDAMAGFAAPPFHPILTDAGGGPTFTMLGTTMRLIATAGTGGRYTVIEQVTPSGWGPPRHIHSCEDEIFGSVAIFTRRQGIARAPSYAQAAKSKKPSMNLICRRRSFPATHRTCPFRIMCIAS